MKFTDDILREFAREAEQAFSEGVDFSNKSKIAKVSRKIHQEFDKFRIGPRALSLLVAFAFDEKKREKIWKEMGKVVRENR